MRWASPFHHCCTLCFLRPLVRMAISSPSPSGAEISLGDVVVWTQLMTINCAQTDSFAGEFPRIAFELKREIFQPGIKWGEGTCESPFSVESRQRREEGGGLTSSNWPFCWENGWSGRMPRLLMVFPKGPRSEWPFQRGKKNPFPALLTFTHLMKEVL